MKVNEIFASIEGEGIRAGLPCVFIRLHGCNLHCSYCDSNYACEGSDYAKMSIDTIVDKVKSYGVPRATVTGGEPLIQKDIWKLIRKLSDEKISVNVETNGSIDISRNEKFSYEDNLIITMDWKSISSGESTKMLESNLDQLTDSDVLKFVVGNTKDLDQMRSIIDNHDLDCHLFVSPVFGKIEARNIVEYLLKNHLNNVRIQLQIHKYIWDPNKRGV